MLKAAKRSPECVNEIRKKRCGAGYFYPWQMVAELEKHGVKMTRQTWSNKEQGRTDFTVSELQALAEIFEMPVSDAVSFFTAGISENRIK